MTIIVNTPPASSGNAASSAGAAGSAANAGASGDLFASLLGVQMSMVGGLLPGMGEGGDGKASDDKPAAKSSDDDGAAQAALAMPLLAALQGQQLQQANVKGPEQDLLAQQGAAKIDPSALLQVGKQGFNWQSDQQKLPEQDASAPQFLPLQAAQQPQTQQTHAASAVPQLALPQTLNDPSWGKALGEQVLSMVNLKMDKAQIQLNPPQMGPIEITLKMNGNDQAQVLFTAAVPATREALENNMHRLSAMLSSSGIQLTDSQVSSGNSGQQQQAFQQKRERQQQGSPEADGVDALAAIKAARGILSIFA
ncbi:flagellar hook-length control protein FliK [Chromobacterium alticapitis]|uniref:Flagellar hook-length control protein FliK n=1 Tax=Chromobacterium alticapitis TaxID=2073169 RepID=A0A2S5DBU3_9NEIS|nr:flagellar hook-length control protein FliK [Chromobacterium alticapitis]POZ60481.1 flagellar hook-length control protein FliK [Chromobacterium alticapitis]